MAYAGFSEMRKLVETSYFILNIVFLIISNCQRNIELITKVNRGIFFVRLIMFFYILYSFSFQILS